MDPRWYEGATGRTAVDAHAAASQFVAHADDPENAANPLFSADWYRATYGVSGPPSDLLLHYVLAGEAAGLKPHLWFDPGYFRRFQRVGTAEGCALAEYCRTWKDNPSAHPYFDGAWYVWQYPDVLHSWLNPLAHFVAHGLAEGREPNAYFSSRWYVNAFEDVRKCGQNAAAHFCMHGGPEWRSPGPNFSMTSYAEQFPEFAETGLDPFAHFLAYGQGPNAATRYLNLWDLVENRHASPPVPLPGGQVVEIIVPVYRGLAETRACIESILASRNQNRTRIRVYNDASPEPELAAYLREVADRGDIVLVENEKNLGFVGTVNAGMRVALAQRDTFAVILLNSDTEVAPGWVDRMVAHAGKSGTGTVTATSNSATICSFPSIGSHPWPEGASVRDLDRLASEANPGMSVEIPTGVGFCMLITRACLEEVGRFDEDAFGRGYGEENDFCMRASARGYKHLQALDVFVAHVGEVSFAEDGTPGKANAARIMRERYPDYEATVAKHCATDPAKVARLRMIGAMWRAGDSPVTAIVTHNLGGGTERHVQDVIAELGEHGRVVVLRPGLGHQSLLKLENGGAHDAFDVVVDAVDGPGFARLLAFLGVQSVQIHHLYDHGELVRDGLALSRIPYSFYLHDYYVICPQITLITANDEYCGEPDARSCDTCIARRPELRNSTDIRNWREAHEWAVVGASRVLAPSHDVANRIKRYMRVEPEVRYLEDPVMARPAGTRLARAARRPGDLRVVMLGVLSLTKGRKKIFEAIGAAERMNYPLAFHLIGDPLGFRPSLGEGRFSFTGWYKEPELEGLIEAADADVFLFASAAPETYSFTLSAAMRTGRPIVATTLGAFIERLVDYPAKEMYPHDLSGEGLAALLNGYATRLRIGASGTGRPPC